MANRFPLVLDTTDGNKIKEIPSGDNLDLRNVSIEDVQNINAVGTINAAAVTINGSQLQPGIFSDLDDTPNSYEGFEGYLVKVKDDGTGIEFTTLGAGGSDFAVDDILLSGDIVPQTLNTSNIGSTTNRFAQIHSQIFQGSLKGFDGSTVFDATSNQIPYAVIAGRPENVSDLPNDADYISRSELTDGSITVEVSNTGDLIGSVFGDDSTLLVDHLNSRINAARLTQNGANDGQTIVWNDATKVWEPGIAGDITGLSSNKVDTLTVEAGYKFTFADNPGLIEGAGIQFTTTSDPVSFNGDMELADGKTFAPATDGDGAIGSVSLRFGNGYFDNLDGNSITGTLTGTAEATSIKTDSAVLGDKTAGDGGYDIHVVGAVGFTGGSMNMNGSDLIAPNLVNATGDIKGSVFGDDSTPLVDAVSNTLSGNIVTSSITGSIITIDASTKVSISDVELQGSMYPDTTETGFIGTTSKKFGEGNFVTVNSDTISVASFSTTSITTEDLTVTGTGTGEITSGSDLVFTSGNRTRFEGGPVKITNVDQIAKQSIVAQNGDVIYNTSENGFQLYENGAWTTLHKGIFTGDIIGSVFTDDSTTIIDGVAGKVIAPTVSGDATFEDNVIVSGNLTVQGTTTSIETTNTNITDNVIELNSGESGAGITAGTAGIEIERGTETNVTFVYDDTVDKWTLGTETLVAGTFEGNVIGNVTGDVTGNITGDTTGYHTGDVTGSVFADNSTILVDAVNGNISWNVISNAPAFLTSVAFGDLTTTPTTLAGYGITDAATSAQGALADSALQSGDVFDVQGSVFADDSTVLVDSVAGKIVGDYENGTSTIGSTRVESYDIKALQDTNTTDLYVANSIYGGETGTIKNVAIGSTPPANSTGADGDRAGMVAFDSTSIYYCIANWASPGTADIWVKQDWGTTGSW